MKEDYILNWDIVLSIIAGLATAIPLLVKLVQYVEKAVREKNWNRLLDLIMNLMAEAERKFSDGATRKEWVLAMVKTSADTINFDVDINAVSALIDELCNLTKQVNTKQEGIVA